MGLLPRLTVTDRAAGKIVLPLALRLCYHNLIQSGKPEGLGGDYYVQRKNSGQFKRT